MIHHYRHTRTHTEERRSASECTHTLSEKEEINQSILEEKKPKKGVMFNRELIL